MNQKTLTSPAILVIGDVMVDRYWFGSPNSLAAEAPVAVLGINSVEDRAGGAANVALNIKKLGGNVAILAPLGRDEVGESLKKILTQEGVSQEWIYGEKQTICKHRILSEHQQLVRVDFEQKYNPIQLNDQIKEIIREYDVIVCSDYSKGSLNFSAQIISFANSIDKIVIVDPKGLDFTQYQDAYLLTPNYKEFTDIVGVIKDQVDFDLKAYNLLNKLNLEYLLVTCGKDGMILYGKNKFKYSASSYASQVYDVTGAGDTVIASLAISLANKEDKIQAIERASHAAAVVVSKLGTYFVTEAEINQQMEQLLDNNSQALDKACKIFVFENNQQYSQLLDKYSDHVVYKWSSQQGLFEAEHIKNIIALQHQDEKKILVILDINKNTKAAHTSEELAYMISKISIVDKVLYGLYVN